MLSNLDNSNTLQGSVFGVDNEGREFQLSAGSQELTIKKDTNKKNVKTYDFSQEKTLTLDIEPTPSIYKLIPLYNKHKEKEINRLSGLYFKTRKAKTKEKLMKRINKIYLKDGREELNRYEKQLHKHL